MRGTTIGFSGSILVESGCTGMQAGMETRAGTAFNLKPGGHGEPPPLTMKQRFAMPVSPSPGGREGRGPLREFHVKGIDCSAAPARET